MIHNLPNDIINNIIDELFNRHHPIELLKLRNINKLFRNQIDEKKLSKCNIYADKNINHKINEILHKKTHINQIKWLMDNHVTFNLNHVKTIITHNRIDIINQGFYYKAFLELLFNRFYLCEENTQKLCVPGECNNPIIVAAKINRVEIVRLLIESASIGNPYTKVISGLLDISIKYGHKNLFCYLVTYQFDSIKQLVISKIGKIINRMDNCEDIFFYLITNGKIKVDLKLLLGCINKDYSELFYNSYPKYFQSNDKGKRELFVKTIDVNNHQLFNYIVKDHIILDKDFTKLIMDYGKFTNEFLYNLINNHINRITKDSKLIYMCLTHELEDEVIKQLIQSGYYYDVDEMNIVLSNNNIPLLREMCNYKI